MDAALVINGVVDTVARDVESVAGMPAPAGKWMLCASGSVFGGFRYDGTNFSAPPVKAPDPTAPYDISKAELWRRTTEDEAEALRAALSQSSARLQGIFEGATILRTDDPDFPTMRAGIVAAVGEARANVLLAPTS